MDVKLSNIEVIFGKGTTFGIFAGVLFAFVTWLAVLYCLVHFCHKWLTREYEPFSSPKHRYVVPRESTTPVNIVPLRGIAPSE